MSKPTKQLLGVLTAILFMILQTAFARADDQTAPITLRSALINSATSPHWTDRLKPWADQIERDSDQTLKIQPFFDGRLAQSGNTYERLVAGAADLVAGFQSSDPGKFPRSSVADLPFQAETARDGSAALWELYEKGLLGNEYSEIVPLALFTYTPTTLHLKTTVKSLEDLKGMKIATSGKVISDTIASLGAVPISVGAGEYYESRGGGTVGGFGMQWTGMSTFKIYEVTTYNLDVGLGNGAGYLAMNKESFDRLPEKAKAALKRNSGYGAARAQGAALDKLAKVDFDKVSAMPGHNIARLEPKEEERWVERAASVVRTWEQATPDGTKIVESFQAAVAKSKALP